MPPGDRKPLVLSTYLDAQEHLPYADDSNAVTPMSEENGAMVVPMYYTNLGAWSSRVRQTRPLTDSFLQDRDTRPTPPTLLGCRTPPMVIFWAESAATAK